MRALVEYLLKDYSMSFFAPKSLIGLLYMLTSFFFEVMDQFFKKFSPNLYCSIYVQF